MLKSHHDSPTIASRTVSTVCGETPPADQSQGRQIFVERVMLIAAFVVPLLLYIGTATPDVGLWDTGEMAVVPYIFGVAHPTGFPAFVMLGWLFSHLFAIGAVAWRMTIFSALCTAGTACMLYRLARPQVGKYIAFAATLCLSMNPIIWTRATRAEVHTLALFFEASIIALSLSLRATSMRARYAWTALPILSAIGLAVHPVLLWTLPGAAILAVTALCHQHTSQRAASLRALAVGILIGSLAFVACYATIPWRSMIASEHHLDPTLSLGLPPGMPFWDYAHPTSLSSFLWYISGQQFHPRGALTAIFAVTQYWDYATHVAPIFLRALTPIGILLALLGLVNTLRRDRSLGLAFAAFAFVGVPFAVVYGIEIDNERYLLASFFVLTLLAAYGADDLGRVVRARRPSLQYLPGALLVLSCVWLVATNQAIFLQPRNYEGRDIITRIAHETPSDAIIVTPWVYATPLGYASFIEHSLGGRIIVTAELPDMSDRYQTWSNQHPVFLLDDGAFQFTAPPLNIISHGDAFPRLLEVVNAKDHHPDQSR